MTDKELYETAIKFLLSFEGVTSEVLEKHLSAEHNKPNDLTLIYFKLCESAQNRQMSSKVISGSINGLENLSSVLYDFNPIEVSKNLKKDDSLLLLDIIIENLKPKGQIRRTSKSIWPQYCKSIIDSAHFLSTFKNAENFYEWANFFAHDSRAKAALPLMIGYEISGIGFPLACDFLKEIGFDEFGKPDVHLKEIFKAIGFLDESENSQSKLDYQTLKIIDRIAKENNTSSYAVDKIFWLIGSGNFYLTGLNIGRQKKAFIERFD